jgi:hypothetical protein
MPDGDFPMVFLVVARVYVYDREAETIQTNPVVFQADDRENVRTAMQTVWNTKWVWFSDEIATHHDPIAGPVPIHPYLPLIPSNN